MWFKYTRFGMVRESLARRAFSGVNDELMVYRRKMGSLPDGLILHFPACMTAPGIEREANVSTMNTTPNLFHVQAHRTGRPLQECSHSRAIPDGHFS